MTMLCLVLIACGGGGKAADDADTANDAALDAPMADAAVDAPGCIPHPENWQCSNCIDDDGDGFVDGDDPECTAPYDWAEGDFRAPYTDECETGIPRDCFFDSGSGSGDDGCDQHLCCILGAPDQASCLYDANQYDPSQCGASQQCIDFCQPLTPPDCDCFGCCTLCHEGTCRDVFVSACVSDCTHEVVADGDRCPACVKSDTCRSLCDDPGAQSCTTSADCDPTAWCARGCCVALP